MAWQLAYHTKVRREPLVQIVYATFGFPAITNLLKTLDCFANTPANLRQLLGAENQSGYAGDDSEFRHSQTKKAAARESLSPPISGPCSGHKCPVAGTTRPEEPAAGTDERGVG
ncbi:hypothetical protein V2J09_001125 [Rumex salicifolius]